MENELKSIISKITFWFSQYEEKYIEPKASKDKSFFKSPLIKGIVAIVISSAGSAYSIFPFFYFLPIAALMNILFFLVGLYGLFQLFIAVYSYMKYSKFLLEDKPLDEGLDGELNSGYADKSDTYSMEDKKNKTVAALLAIFLGSFGIHKFYLSKMSGLWYVLFFWTGIPAIVGLVEGILLLEEESKFNQNIITVMFHQNR